MTDTARENLGWRTGRPVEDPEKTKAWGWITVKPSEYLVHCRRGAVLPGGGQGATCFKRPHDSIAVVPTSFQRLQFVADQVTLERIGVAVTGLAVYRIADPLLAYRVLNFSYPERAQEKLEATLTEMLIGATRRLVANLSVDECLQQRKAALADELLREIAPVIGGRGHPEDTAPQGWGIVLDTIEIQEVRILSEAVFAAMQTPYRAKLEREARLARADAEKQSALSEAAAEREIELERADVAAAVRARHAEVAEEEARAEIAAHEVKARAQQLRVQLKRDEWAAELEQEAAEAAVENDIKMRRAEINQANAKAQPNRYAAISQGIAATVDLLTP